MWNEPTEAELRRLPALYATENVPWQEKVVREHFFLGGSDWFLVEYGEEERIFFGFVVLNGDLANAEWGYISFLELRSLNVRGLEIDRDLYWTPQPAGSIGLIRAACG